MLLNGVFPAITTPFYPDGNVYYKKLEHNVERYSRTPITGMVVQGSTGEAIMLSDQEKRDVFKTAIAAAAPEKVLIAATGIESAHETLRLTEYVAGLGYDVAMIRTPHFYKVQMKPATMLAFYRTIADRSPLPILIYSVPVFTGYDMPAELVIELADHPNIIGIKESGGDVAKAARMVQATRHVKRSATVTETFTPVTPRMLKAAASDAAKDGGELVTIGGSSGSSKPSSSSVNVISSIKTRQKEVGFQVLVGAAQTLKASFEAGAAGGILGFACPAPTACFEIYAAWKEGDHALAEEKQQRINEAAKRVVGEFGIPGVKYAMDMNGYYGGPCRSPLLPLVAEQKMAIEKLMSDLRN